MKKNKNVVIIRKSCLTGKPVWIYEGPSEGAARNAYWRACKKEISLVRNWGDHTERIRSSISHFLTELTSRFSLTDEMTPEQKEGARKLQKMMEEEDVCYREFYDHIMEERRRRMEDREIRRKMRERAEQEKNQNRDYDK